MHSNHATIHTCARAHMYIHVNIKMHAYICLGNDMSRQLQLVDSITSFSQSISSRTISSESPPNFAISGWTPCARGLPVFGSLATVYVRRVPTSGSLPPKASHCPDITNISAWPLSCKINPKLLLFLFKLPVNWTS
jgi:hypothetical protein